MCIGWSVIDMSKSEHYIAYIIEDAEGVRVGFCVDSG